MTLIKKKNLQEGEELLYVPELHWMYMVRHVFFFLPILVTQFTIWRHLVGMADTGLIGWLVAIPVLAARNAFWSTFAVVLVILVFRTITFVTSEYGVTNKRLIMKKGLFFLRVTEISIDRIESIFCYRGLFGKIFRYGTIRIGGVGGKVLEFHMVRRPFALRRKIVDIMEKNKTITVVHGELPKPSPPPVVEIEAEPEPEPIYRYGTFVRVLRND